MRTTVDLPPDIHGLARQLAHDGGRSMSEVVVELIRLGLRQRAVGGGAPTSRGMLTISVGRPVTVEDVRSLEDE